MQTETLGLRMATVEGKLCLDREMGLSGSAQRGAGGLHQVGIATAQPGSLAQVVGLGRGRRECVGREGLLVAHVHKVLVWEAGTRRTGFELRPRTVGRDYVWRWAAAKEPHCKPALHAYGTPSWRFFKLSRRPRRPGKKRRPAAGGVTAAASEHHCTCHLGRRSKCDLLRKVTVPAKRKTHSLKLLGACSSFFRTR